MLDYDGLLEFVEPLVAKGQYEKAIQAVGAASRNVPDDVRLLLLLGRLHHRATGARHAKSFFERAAKHAGGDDEVLRRVEMFRRATALLPSSRTDIENFCNPDIVLVQAPGWGVNTPPLATAMLTAYARKCGYRVLPIDLNVEFYLNRPVEFDTTWELDQSLWFWRTGECVNGMMKAFRDKIEAFLDLVLATGAPMVGFTLYSSSAHISTELARMLKKRRPAIQIIFGGPHASRYSAGPAMIQDPCVDAVALGEGELTLVDILDRAKAGHPLTDCPGLFLRVGGEVVDTGDRELIKDLDQVPPPDFSDFAFELYRTPTRLPLMSSRGCPNRCIFCNERPFWKTFRGRSAESVFAEIQTQLARHPYVTFLDFQDSLVNGQVRELERLADLILENGLKVQWSGQAVIRKEMTTELMVKLKRSGCVCLAYGLESPSESLMLRIGKVMSKGADVNAIAEAHGRSGLGVTYNFMFGLPGETEEDAFEAHEFLRRNRQHNLAVNPSSCFCGFAPGTLVHEDPARYGVDLSRGHLYWESTDRKNTYITRLKRFEDFCRLVQELGISTTYPSTTLLDRNRTLGHYYVQAGDNQRACWYFKAWLEEHPGDEEIRAALLACCKASDQAEEGQVFLEQLSAGRPAQPADANGECVDSACKHTDENWLNGVARSWGTGLFVTNSVRAQKAYAAGKRISLADGSTRTIVNTKADRGSLIIFLDGAPLDGKVVGHPYKFTVHQASN